MLTYLVVPTNHLAKDSAGPLAELIDFAASATGQADLVPLGWPPTRSSTFGYTPLTGPLQTYASAASGVAAEVAKEGSTPAPPSASTTTTIPPHDPNMTTTATTTMAVSASGATSQPGPPASGVDGSSALADGTGGSPTISERARAGGVAASGAGDAATRFPETRTGAGAAAHFVVEGEAVTDHPESSLLAASLGAGAPWLLVLGGGALGLGLLLRRRDRLDVGVP